MHYSVSHSSSIHSTSSAFGKSNKNIAKNRKIGIGQEEWDKMKKKISSVWQSPLKELFDSNTGAIKQGNPLTESAIDYIEKEWISRQIHFAHYSVNQYIHIGHFSSQRAKGTFQTKNM